jgi:hypothetical protein
MATVSARIQVVVLRVSGTSWEKLTTGSAQAERQGCSGGAESGCGTHTQREEENAAHPLREAGEIAGNRGSVVWLCAHESRRGR